MGNIFFFVFWKKNNNVGKYFFLVVRCLEEKDGLKEEKEIVMFLS